MTAKLRSMRSRTSPSDPASTTPSPTASKAITFVLGLTAGGTLAGCGDSAQASAPPFEFVDVAAGRSERRYSDPGNPFGPVADRHENFRWEADAGVHRRTNGRELRISLGGSRDLLDSTTDGDRTRDAGKSWERQDGGLPKEQGWFTVLRQAMDTGSNARNPGVYFGTTQGDVWASRNGGETWECVARHLPKITSVRCARFA